MAKLVRDVVIPSFIFLVTITICTGIFQRVMTKFTENKCVLTSHTTLQKISKIKCVERCNQERMNNMCTLAGYNKVTKTCYLSVDNPDDVLNTTDEMSGVFFFEQGMSPRIMILIKNCIWHICRYRIYAFLVIITFFSIVWRK